MQKSYTNDCNAVLEIILMDSMSRLRELDYNLNEINTILSNNSNDIVVLDCLESKRNDILKEIEIHKNKIQDIQKTNKKLVKAVIRQEKEFEKQFSKCTFTAPIDPILMTVHTKVY